MLLGVSGSVTRRDLAGAFRCLSALLSDPAPVATHPAGTPRTQAKEMSEPARGPRAERPTRRGGRVP